MPLFREQRVWQRINPNWSRCLCMGHRGFESNRRLVSAKSNAFYLDNSKDCESMVYILIVDHWINHVKTV